MVGEEKLFMYGGAAMCAGRRKKLQNQATVNNIRISMRACSKQLRDQTVINSNIGNCSLGFYWLSVA